MSVRSDTGNPVSYNGQRRKEGCTMPAVDIESSEQYRLYLKIKALDPVSVVS